jgi:hypothetical protein
MNPKNALSDNQNKKPLQDSPLTTVMKPIELLELSIKQKEQLKKYFPTEVKTYPLPVNYII